MAPPVRKLARELGVDLGLVTSRAGSVGRSPAMMCMPPRAAPEFSERATSDPPGNAPPRFLSEESSRIASPDEHLSFDHSRGDLWSVGRLRKPARIS